ncbi:MAG: ABC transporter ATP-binding protein [Planctomycetales bacterium]|nr:ABC transporter ATP-binding protein [Planctomycetales bacterium]
MTAAIELRHVDKSFRRTRVLANMSLSVEQGSTFAFLGRNGAGKTTTIRMLLGLLPRDDGDVRVLGIDPAVDPLAIRARVGYLAEDQRMYGWMRVDEIIRFVAPFYETWDHDLALKYVREFELPLAQKIKTLSKGQTVRLGLVLALAHRPELVILDDPALGLDPVMRRQFNRDLITHLQGEGRTVFYSSHLLYEVEPVADEVAILDGGRVVRQADTETLRRDVKQFVLPVAALATIRDDLAVLDLQVDGDEAAVIVQNAGAASALLTREGTTHRVVDLNLDEIFAAYVSGSIDDTTPATQQPAIVGEREA